MSDPWLAKMSEQTPAQRAEGERLVCRDCRMMRLFHMDMWMCAEGHMVGLESSDGHAPSFVDEGGLTVRVDGRVNRALTEMERNALNGWMEDRYE